MANSFKEIETNAFETYNYKCMAKYFRRLMRGEVPKWFNEEKLTARQSRIYHLMRKQINNIIITEERRKKNGVSLVQPNDWQFMLNKKQSKLSQRIWRDLQYILSRESKGCKYQTILERRIGLSEKQWALHQSMNRILYKIVYAESDDNWKKKYGEYYEFARMTLDLARSLSKYKKGEKNV